MWASSILMTLGWIERVFERAYFVCARSGFGHFLAVNGFFVCNLYGDQTQITIFSFSQRFGHEVSWPCCDKQQPVDMSMDSRIFSSRSRIVHHQQPRKVAIHRAVIDLMHETWFFTAWMLETKSIQIWFFTKIFSIFMWWILRHSLVNFSWKSAGNGFNFMQIQRQSESLTRLMTIINTNTRTLIMFSFCCCDYFSLAIIDFNNKKEADKVVWTWCALTTAMRCQCKIRYWKQKSWELSSIESTEWTDGWLDGSLELFEASIQKRRKKKRAHRPDMFY